LTTSRNEDGLRNLCPHSYLLIKKLNLEISYENGNFNNWLKSLQLRVKNSWKNLKITIVCGETASFEINDLFPG
jgi:hypothetical protein